MMTEELDISKLKVPELRAELGKRGLNTFGTRQVLVDRLSEAIGTQLLNATAKESTNGDLTTDAERKSDDNIPPTAAVEESCQPAVVENGNTSESAKSHGETDVKRKRSPSPAARRSRSRDRESRRSPKRRSRSPQPKSSIPDEPLGWEESSTVFLDTYNSDLSLVIDSNGYSAKPLTHGGFCIMWAGVRANYGVVSGKCVKNLSVDNKDSLSGGATHVVRVGWSTENTDFTLGEEAQSFGYGGTAKKSCNNKFSDYGCTFGEDDVVGAFLEWTDSEAVMRFSVNGVDQGECFRVERSSLGDSCALFPHVYVKNVEFTANFGQDGQAPWYPPAVPNDDPMSWKLINGIDASSKIHGRKPPASRSECEVIMMVGLPGAGKTYYADRLRKDNPEKQYNVLGTNLILDKMKVLNLGRQRNYHSRWNVLIQEATDCLNELFKVASKRRRNYILDQTNVYPSAQRRKMRPFEGFKRKAIVIVPTDEEFRRRIAQREKEEGKEVPESAILEMKANFGIPKAISDEPDSVFDEVLFTELEAGPASELISKYNQEGQANRGPPEKRQRWESSNRDRDDSRRRDRDRSRDFGRGRRDDFRRSPNRRDDRGRRDYRGGYNASRDRSRDRYDRGRDDSYSRSPNDRFSGPGGRFGGPPRGGGYPGMGPRGGFGSPYGAPPRGGPGGMPPMRRGRGGPMPDGMGRGGYGFDAGSSMDYRGDGRPSRGRGGFRPGEMDGGFGAESMYGYDMGADPSAAMQGAYRGGYGAPPGRGAYGAPPDAGGYGRMPPGRGGRGGGPSDRGGRGGGSDRGGRGGRQSGFDRNYPGQSDSSGGYPMGGGRPSSFSAYPPGAPSDNSAYPGGDGQSDKNRSRFSAPDGSYGPQGQAGKAYPEAYPGAGQSGYPADAYSNPPNPYPPANYGAGPGSYGGTQRGSNRPPSRGSGAQPGGKTPDMQQSDTSSLYASGAAAARSGASSQPSTPRQSRFDSKSTTSPAAPSQQYAGYPQGGYQTGYPGVGAYGTESNTSASAAPARAGRSRFDSAAPQQSSQQPAAGQQASQTAQQQAQAYGYTYGTQPGKAAPTGASQAAAQAQQQAYPYNYGYPGYGNYTGQTAQSAATGQTRSTSGAPATTTPSLYASAISDKAQQQSAAAAQATTATPSSTTPAAATPSAAASYAYYGYGAMPSTAQPPPTGSAAQQQQQAYGAWPQSAAAGANMAAAAAAYASYYPGYSAYAGYGAAAAPTTQSTTPSTATSAPTTQSVQQAMQAQYYGGAYRS